MQDVSQASYPAAGVELIKEFEGLHIVRPDGYIHAYPDPLSGNLPITIGWGSTQDTLRADRFELGDKIYPGRRLMMLLEHQARV